MVSRVGDALDDGSALQDGDGVGGPPVVVARLAWLRRRQVVCLLVGCRLHIPVLASVAVRPLAVDGLLAAQTLAEELGTH